MVTDLLDRDCVVRRNQNYARLTCEATHSLHESGSNRTLREVFKKTVIKDLKKWNEIQKESTSVLESCTDTSNSNLE